MNLLKPKVSVSPQSLEFAATLPPPPSVLNCRFLYPAYDMDKYGIGVFDTYPGRYACSLCFLDDGIPVAQVIRMVEYQKKVGATCFPFYIASDGGTYPTVGGKWGARIDEDKLQRWHDYCLAVIQNTGIWPIPMGHCAENASGYARKNAAEIERIVKAVVTKLDPIVQVWGVGWEASKFWTPAECELVAQIYREYTAKPIIIHNQGWQHATGATINGLAYEWAHHPKYGQQKSAADIKKEYQDVAKKLPGKGLIGGEWTVFTQTAQAAAQRKAITGLPLTFGTWN